VIYYIVNLLNPNIDKKFYICLYMIGKFSSCFVVGDLVVLGCSLHTLQFLG